MPSAAFVFGGGNLGRYFRAPPRASPAVAGASPPLLRGLGCEASTWPASKAAAASCPQGGGGGEERYSRCRSPARSPTRSAANLDAAI